MIRWNYGALADFKERAFQIKLVSIRSRYRMKVESLISREVEVICHGAGHLIWCLRAKKYKRVIWSSERNWERTNLLVRVHHRA